MTDDDNAKQQPTSSPKEEEKEIEEEKKEEPAVVKGKAKEEDEKDYSNWPYKNIKEPHDNDVLYGRGGGTNHHPGNKRYRKMVEDKKIEYVNCKRLDKPLVALSIIKIWRGQKPPGRFLKMDDKTGLWSDVGDKKAREKTSQALREKAPEIRKELEREKRIKNGEPVSEEEEESAEERPGIVARDHSLGRDYVPNNEGMSLSDFRWTEGVRERSDTFLPQGSREASDTFTPQVPYQFPNSRTNSNTSFMQPEMPPPGVFPEHMTSVDQVHLLFSEQQQQRYDSGGSVPPVPVYNYPPVHTTSGGSAPPPVPIYNYPPMHSSSESSGSGPPLPGCYNYPPTHTTSNGSAPPPVPGYQYPPVHTTSWSARDHSLSQNQLPHATCNQAAFPAAFDQTRTPSGHWRPPPMPMSYHYTPPGGHTLYHVPSGNNSSPYAQPTQQQQQQQQQQQIHYTVDPAVASQWSSQAYSGVPPPPPLQQQQSSSQSSQDIPPPPVEELSRDVYLPVAHSKPCTNAPKPEIVKRATSHQNETAETKHGFDGQSVKRAFVSRDGSIASNRLKQDFCHSSEDSSTIARPSALTLEERMSTLDLDASSSTNNCNNERPKAVTARNRLSTIDALTLDFDNPDKGLEDLFDQPEENSQQYQVVSKPSSLRSEFRVTTMDLIDIVNEPFPFTEV